MLHFKPGAEPIPGYRLVKFLGKGQFGQVWESTAPGGSAAALKFLDLGGKQGWKEFRGIQRVKKLRHANLMPITALWLLDEDGVILDEDQVRTVLDGEQDADKTVVPPAADDRHPRWLVVAQLLGDGTLADELEQYREQGQQGLPVELLLNYMEEAAKGIDYLNSSHRDLGEGLFAVQHCDIKPANILLLGGSALVCDFGVAQVLMDAEAQARATGMMGSPAYMPPECALATPSSTSDQYSLAVSYFELRTGELPFDVKTQLAVLDAHRAGQLVLDKLPKAEQAVIRKATSVDPKKRYADCQTMVEKLRAAVHGPVTPGKPRTKAILLSVLAGILMAAAVTAIPSLLPTPTTTYTIHVEPKAATVTVNGESTEVVEGVATVKLEAEQTATIQASHSPDFEPASFHLDASQYDPQTVIEIELQRSAGYLAAQAFQLMDSDPTDAISHYAKAIEKDPAYARFPLPTTLMKETEGAELRPIKCSLDGRWLIGVSRDGEVYGWEITKDISQIDPRVLHKHDRVRCLAVGRSWVVSAGEDEQVVATSLDGQTGNQQRAIRWAQPVYALAISREDRFVVIGDSEGKLHRWELARVDATPQPIGQHRDSVDRIVIPSGTTDAFSASWDQTVGKWSIEQPNEKAGPFAEAVDGIEAIAATEDWLALADKNQVKISAVEQAQWTVLPADHADAVVALAFNQTGSLLATGSEDGKITIWQSPQDAERAEWTDVPVPTQHIQQAVNSLAFDPRTDFLFSASNDKTVVLWDAVATLNRATVVYRGESSPTAVCVSADGRWLFCESADGSVRMWDLRRVSLIKKAADEAKVQPQPATPKANVVEA